MKFELETVDFDPFAKKSKTAGSKFELETVDYDPFLKEAPMSVEGVPIEPGLKADPAMVEKIKAEMLAKKIPPQQDMSTLPLAVNQPPLTGAPADVPLPPERFVPTGDVSLPPVQALEEAPIRTGGGFFDTIAGVGGGMLSPAESVRQTQERIAAAEAGAQQAQAVRPGIEAREMEVLRSFKDKDGTPIVDIVQDLARQRDIAAESGQFDYARQLQVQMNNVIANSPIEFRQILTQKKLDITESAEAKARAEQAQAAATQAKLAPAVTQTQLRSGAETAGETLAGLGADLVGGAQRAITSPVSLVEAITGSEPNMSREVDKTSKAIHDSLTGGFRPDPRQAEDLGMKLTGGIASTVGFAATGVVGRGLKLSQTAGTVIAGALPQAEAQWREAEARAQQDPKFNQEWRKWASFASGLVGGGSEALPIGLLFEKLEKASGGGLTRLIGISAANFGTEGTQEVLQTILNNANSLYILQDPNASLDKGTADALLVGGLSGAIFGGAVAAPSTLRQSIQQMRDVYKTPDAAPPELRPIIFPETSGQISNQFVQPQTAQAAPGAPSSPAVPVEAQGTEGVLPSPSAPPAAPAPSAPVSPVVPVEEAELLKGDGFTVEDIIDMDPAERGDRVKEAIDNGSQRVPLTAEEQQELRPKAPSQEAVDLIEQGVPPLQAMEEAAKKPVSPEEKPTQQLELETVAEEPTFVEPETTKIPPERIEQIKQETEEELSALTGEPVAEPEPAPTPVAEPEAAVEAPKGGDLTQPTSESPVTSEAVVENAAPAGEEDNVDKLSSAFTPRLAADGFKNINDARKVAKETVGSEDPKLVEEAMELAVVRRARQIVDENKGTQKTYEDLVKLYEKQPNLGTRTSTSVLQQAYSTPVPLAYVASRLAGVNKNETVLEPTAGNGALLIESDFGKAYPNELNAVRRRNLEKQGYKATGLDAAIADQLTPGKEADVIITNPPFGSIKDENGDSKVFDMTFALKGTPMEGGTYKTKEIDHAIALKSLEEMKPNGRAVLIVGSVNPQLSKREDGYNGKAKREFYMALYNKYKVKDHFTVSGDLYTKQGASWPVDVIVIEGRGKTDRKLPAVQAPEMITSWEQLGEKLKNEYRATATEAVSAPAEAPKPTAGGPAGGGKGGGAKPAVGGGAAGRKPSAGQPKQPVPPVSDIGKRPVEEPVSAPVSPERPVGGKPVGGGVEPSAGIKPDLFANNTVFTTDAVERARKAIRDKLKTQLNAGFDPEFMMHGLTIAGAYIEAGVRKFADFVKAMLEEFGEAIKPYLLNFYESVRTYPGVDKEGMTSVEDVAAQHNEIMRGSNVIEDTVVDTPAIKQEIFEQIEGERKTPEKMEQVTELQLPYEPASKLGEGLGTLIPINMKSSAENALRNLEQKRGSLDNFVANRLDYKPEDLPKYFSAEQIDAIALALDNIEKGSGFIIGDQTGIGKGRINAAIIRYALINKKIPIFITVKANLYSDMWRDMKAIGLDKYLKRNPRVFMTDNNKKVPLEEIGPDGKELKLASGNQLKKVQQFTKDANIGDNDVVFTTYSQMQPQGDGKGNPRHPFLDAIAPKSILIMDESHNAGGSDSDPTKMTSAKFARNLIEKSQGVFYSSATYAKRPDVMDLYSKTDMRLAVADIEELGELISRGGVPLMQINASMLAEAGQMLRRERSFAGVTYDTETAVVDKKTYNDFSKSINEINQFSKIIKKITSGISQGLRGQGQIATGGEGTGGAGAESTNFTAIMHNLISQMLLSMKAQPAVMEAIKSIENGEKPVLTLANTMGSFIKEQMDELDLKNGDKIDMDFGDLLIRYLEKQRYIYITKPFGKKEKHYLTDEELGPEGLAAYNSIRSAIRSKDFSGLVISPIDYIKDELTSRGYKVGEITGREYGINYQGNYPVISQRDPKEISIEGRANTIKGFNSGPIDVMILNQAGSTGISLHASKDFKDQRPRKMILIQPEANVDVHMQMLGRVHRTGQVVLPAYIQLIADIPAEKRPAAILAKKMASLAASTTASRKGGLSSEQILDFMNEYGDQIVGEMLVNDEELQTELDILLSGKDASAIKEGKGGSLDDLIRKFTGRLTLLPLDRQEQIYDELESRYREKIAFEDAQGTNKLEAKNVDLDAKLLDKRVAKEKEGDSPFTGAVEYGLYDVKRPNKPITIRAAIEKLLELQKEEGAILPENDVKALENVSTMFKQRQSQKYAEAIKSFNTYKREILDNTDTDDYDKQQTKLNATLDKFNEYASLVYPGARIRVITPTSESYTALVLDVKNKGKTKNPLALGDWNVTLASPSGAPILNAPFSMLQVGGEIGQSTVIMPPPSSVSDTVESFDIMAKSNREKRVIVTGNLLSAFDMLSGKGQILNFTTETGEIRPGIMLAANIKTLDDAIGSSKTILKNGQEVLTAMQKGINRRTNQITSAKKDVFLKLDQNGSILTITVPGNKATGGKYYLNKDLIALIGSDFSGKKTMSVSVYARRAQFDQIIDKIISLGAKFEAEAKSVAERRASYGLPNAVVNQGQRQINDIKNGIEEIANRVFGSAATVETPTYIPPSDIDIEYARASGYTGPAAELPSPKGFAEIDSVGALRFVVATSSGQVESRFTAYHEADHILEMAGVYTPRELRIREAAVPRMKNILIENGFRPESVAQMSNSEVMANAFAIYSVYADYGRDTMSPFPGGLRNLFDKIRQFIDLFRNWLKGNGFTNIESLMKNQYVGNLAKRAQAQIKQQTVQNDRVVQARKEYSFSENAIQKMEMLNALTGSPTTAKQGAAPSFVRPKIGFTTKFSMKFADRFTYQRDVQNAIEEARGSPLSDGLNPYLLQSTMTPRLSERLNFFRKREVDPIIKLIKKLKLSADDVGMFLVARHAKERNDEVRKIDPKNNKGSGITDDAAKQILDDFDNAGKTQALEQVAQKVYEMIKADRQRRLQAGLLDQKTIDAWDKKYKNYVPLRGFAEIDMDEDSVLESMFVPNIGRGISVSKRESQRALGRGSIPNNPLTMAIMQAEEGYYRIEKNRVAVALLRLARQNPHPELWTVDKFPMKRVLGKDGLVKTVPDIQERYGENVVVAKIGGKVHFIELQNKQLAEAFKNMGVEAMAEPIRKIGEVMRFYSKLYTGRNPDFFYPNMFRDFQSGLVATFNNRPRLAAEYMKQYFPALIEAVRIQAGQDTQMSEDWKKAGGKISYNAYRELATVSKEIEDMVGDIDPIKWSNLPMKTKKAMVKSMQKAFSAIDSLSEPLENAARLAAFRAAKKLGYSDAKAADIALEATTNFTRRGAWGPYLNISYMFYNANTQGSLQSVRWLKNNKRFRYVYASFIPLGFAMAMMNLAMSDDDEAEKGLKNYSNIPEYLRMRNIVIKYGPGKDQYFRIPLMFGLQVPYLIGHELAMLSTGQITPAEFAGNVVGGIINAYNPLGYGSLFSMITPTLLDPALDLYVNERPVSGAPIYPESTDYREGVPKSQQYFATTPDWAISISQFLNNATGGNKVTSGMIDMYPGQIQYAVEKLTAGTGNFAAGIYKWAENTYAGIETPMEKIPIVKSFVPVADRETNRYYDTRQEVLEDANKLRNALREFNKNPNDQVLLDQIMDLSEKTGGIPRGDEIKWVKNSPFDVIRDTDDALSDLRKEVFAIKKDESLSPLQKEKQIREIEDQISELMVSARSAVATKTYSGPLSRYINRE